MLTVKKYAVQEPVILEYEGDPTEQHAEDKVLNDNKYKISFKTEFLGYPL